MRTEAFPEVQDVFQPALDRVEGLPAYMGRQFRALVAPITERVGDSTTYLSRAAATFICAAAIWGAMESVATAEPGGSQSVAARSNPGVPGGEATLPTSPLPAANAECGDPSYRAPKQEQIGSMLCRFNNARSNPLVEDPQLDEAAREKLDEIIADRHYSHHPLSAAEDPFQYTKAVKGTDGTWVVGENLAQAEGLAAKVRGLFGAWRHSASHWRNIINERFTNVGFAVKHVKRIVMDVDVEIGGETYVMPDEVLENVTIWDAEFWGP